MDMDMNLQKCLAFVEVVRCGSFKKAAEKLSYSQSGVSRMVADLERSWGVELLERGRGGTCLTSEGSCLLPYAESLVEEYRRLQMQVNAVNGLESGSIRIGTLSSVATHWLPKVIKRFCDDYPGIEYELVLGDYTEIESWVLEGRVDCGFSRLPIHAGLATRFSEHDELVAVLPEGHPLAECASVPLEHLCEYPFMMLGNGESTDVADIFSDAGLTPNVKFTTWDDYSIMAMIESGMGVGLLHSLILRRAPYRIVTRHLEKPIYREIRLVTRADRTPSSVTERFIGYMGFRDSGPAATD